MSLFVLCEWMNLQRKTTMENLTLENQGMLKTLEHLSVLLQKEKNIKYHDLFIKTGIELKHWKKLLLNEIVIRIGSPNKPVYKWNSIKPNIYMAIETLKDSPDYNNILGIENIIKNSHSEEGMMERAKLLIPKEDKDIDMDEKYRLEYKESKGQFHFNNDSREPDTFGWGTVAICTAEKCNEFANHCYEAYPALGAIIKTALTGERHRYNGSIPLIEEIRREYKRYFRLIDLEKKSIKTANKFIKPTLDQVKLYCVTRKNNINADQFFNYYESNGWKVGNDKMKDWMAAVRYWESRKSQPNSNNKQLKDYTIDELLNELKRRGASGNMSFNF